MTWSRMFCFLMLLPFLSSSCCSAQAKNVTQPRSSAEIVCRTELDDHVPRLKSLFDARTEVRLHSEYATKAEKLSDFERIALGRVTNEELDSWFDSAEQCLRFRSTRGDAEFVQIFVAAEQDARQAASIYDPLISGLQRLNKALTEVRDHQEVAQANDAKRHEDLIAKYNQLVDKYNKMLNDFKAVLANDDQLYRQLNAYFARSSSLPVTIPSYSPPPTSWQQQRRVYCSTSGGSGVTYTSCYEQ